MSEFQTFNAEQRQQALAQAGVTARSSFLSQVYGWMCAGLGITALVAYGTSQSEPLLRAILGNQILFFALILAQLGAVIAISAAFEKLSFTAAAGLFVLYSALSGLTLSVIFLIYTHTSIASVFLITAGTFGAVSFYGMTTKRDLSGWGSYLFMGLIGIILASVVNLFLHSDGLSMAVSYLAVLIFTGLAAYDTQQLMRVHQTGMAQGQAGAKLAVYGALRLYLDFINLFLALLRILGNRR
jgi:hypothetical protein